MSEITDELKKQLLETSNEYKDDIQDALKQAVERLGKTGVNIAIIGGTLLVSYLLYRGIAGSDKKKSKEKKGDESQSSPEIYGMMDKLADKVLEQTLVFLLTLAKERLMSWLSEQNEENGDSEVPSSEE